MNPLFPFWQKYFNYDWKFGVFLLTIVCIPRFLLVLEANQSGNYASIGAVMFLSAMVPFLFLNKAGRKQIGITGTRAYGVLILALLLGVVLSLFFFLAGDILYGTSYQNWYVYIGKSYQIPEVISGQDKFLLFSIMAGTGMLFSPVGEEFFFRGIVHDSIATSIGRQNASIADALAFALTHLAHFGLVYVGGGWEFYPLASTIWVAGMFLVSLLFFRMKRASGSLLGAICCHAGFNLGMIYCIFYLL